MKEPDIVHRVKDAHTGGWYEVIAHRKLTDGEVLVAIETVRRMGCKPPKKGKTQKIIDNS